MFVTPLVKLIEPSWPLSPVPNCKVPPLIVVVRRYVFEAVRIQTLVFDFVNRGVLTGLHAGGGGIGNHAADQVARARAVEVERVVVEVGIAGFLVCDGARDDDRGRVVGFKVVLKLRPNRVAPGRCSFAGSHWRP